MDSVDRVTVMMDDDGMTRAMREYALLLADCMLDESDPLGGICRRLIDGKDVAVDPDKFARAVSDHVQAGINLAMRKRGLSVIWTDPNG